MYFKFSNKEAEAAAAAAEAAALAKEEASLGDTGEVIEWDDDTPEEKEFKEKTPRWKFTLRVFKTSISPVIAKHQEE